MAVIRASSFGRSPLEVAGNSLIRGSQLVAHPGAQQQQRERTARNSSERGTTSSDVSSWFSSAGSVDLGRDMPQLVAQSLRAETLATADNALSLPLKSFTSGRRRTYDNKSTFQAHVCCLTDPQLAPCVAEVIRTEPRFASARTWPYAFRVVPPVRRKAQDGSEDDG